MIPKDVYDYMVSGKFESSISNLAEAEKELHEKLELLKKEGIDVTDIEDLVNNDNLTADEVFPEEKRTTIEYKVYKYLDQLERGAKIEGEDEKERETPMRGKRGKYDSDTEETEEDTPKPKRMKKSISRKLSEARDTESGQNLKTNLS